MCWERTLFNPFPFFIMTIHHFNMDLPAAMGGYYEWMQNVPIGEIDRIEVYWPLNTLRYVGVWFIDGNTQIIPSEGYFTGNGNIQNFRAMERIDSGILRARAVNVDPDYDHMIDAWVSIIPKRGSGDLDGF